MCKSHNSHIRSGFVSPARECKHTVAAFQNINTLPSFSSLFVFSFFPLCLINVYSLLCWPSRPWFLMIMRKTPGQHLNFKMYIIRITKTPPCRNLETCLFLDISFFFQHENWEQVWIGEPPKVQRLDLAFGCHSIGIIKRSSACLVPLLWFSDWIKI